MAVPINHDAIVGKRRSRGNMAVERIHRAMDPRVAGYRDVRDGELLRSRGMFMAEGRLVVRRIVEDGRFCVQSLLVNDAALHDLSEAVEAAAPDVPMYVCGAEEMRAISGYDVHRGCLA